MSRIGDLNLELQEQANELGYSTVQEALDAGYSVNYGDRKLVMDDRELAELEWEQEKIAKRIEELKRRIKCE